MSSGAASYPEPGPTPTPTTPLIRSSHLSRSYSSTSTYSSYFPSMVAPIIEANGHPNSHSHQHHQHQDPSASTSSGHAHAPGTRAAEARRQGGLRKRLGRGASWLSISHELENKGSVARDHLALERTYLAWLRTSLSLASIGVAITQLFRLQVTSTGSSSSPSNTGSVSLDATLATRSLPPPSALHQLTPDPSTAELLSLLAQYSDRIAALEQRAALSTLHPANLLGRRGEGDGTYDPEKYRHLGKPVGGTFIAVALVFLMLGTHRYFRVQRALMEEPSKFPPSRRSVAFSTFIVAGIVIAAFAAILAIK